MQAITLHRDDAPRTIGRSAERHGLNHARRRRLGAFLAARVARAPGEFMNRHDDGRDGRWTAPCDGRIAGAIASGGLHAEARAAHPRRFIAGDALRGSTAGAPPPDTALACCHQRGERSVASWTFSGLDAVRRLCARAGCALAEEHDGTQRGERRREQRFTPALRP
ncbi:hypothetical protein [Solimonas flava]|uniref:hypothetical protein n=1 Tax=Solimonas flava TaxID=415849 RepID=UPI0003F8762F|nr:hypothetical protein [Solimonas flava]